MGISRQNKKRSKKIITGQNVYNKVQPIAEAVKAIIQMAIGIVTVIVLVIQIIIHRHGSTIGIGDRALGIIGSALALSAAVELAYTFFTDGPDEAIDPLVLGLSSFGLIEISQSGTHLSSAAIPILLISIAIAVLFVARRFLLEIRKEDADNSEDIKPPESYLG